MSYRAKGKNIIRLRNQRGWSQRKAISEIERAAKAIQFGTAVSRNTYISAEKSETLQNEKLIFIAKFYKVPLEEVAEIPTNADTKNGYYYWNNCQEDLIDWERKQQSSERLVIKDLAIDFTLGLDFITSIVNQTNSSFLDIRILMLVGDPGLLEGIVFPNVKAWAKAARSNLEELKTLLGHFQGNNRQIQIRVKQYCKVPTIHGFMAEKGKGYTKHYITCCHRSNEGNCQEYLWGDGEYSMISGNESSDKLIKIRKDFDSLFGELWESSGDAVVDQVLGAQ